MGFELHNTGIFSFGLRSNYTTEAKEGLFEEAYSATENPFYQLI